MKKSIISLVLVLSFCFQSTYPLFEGLKQKKDQAMKLLKRLKPKGLITRFKEAKKALNAAEQAYISCITKNCNAEYGERFRTLRMVRSGYATRVDRLRYRQANTNYEICTSDRCANEKRAFEKASSKFGSMVAALTVGIELGVIGVIVGAAVVGAHLEERAEEREQQILDAQSAVRESQRRRFQAKRRQEIGIQTESIEPEEFPEPTKWKVSPVYEEKETIDIQDKTPAFTAMDEESKEITRM